MTDPFTGSPDDAALLMGMERLSTIVEAHTGQLRDTVQSITDVEKDQTAMSRVLRWLRGLVAFDITATLVAFVLAIVTVVTINGIISDLRGSVREQCTDKAIWLSLYRPQGPVAGSPITASRYHEIFQREQDSADRLECGIKHVVP